MDTISNHNNIFDFISILGSKNSAKNYSDQYKNQQILQKYPLLADTISEISLFYK